jgi:chaperonin GroEL
VDLRRGSQPAVDRVVEFLAAHTKPITEIAQVATISADGHTHVDNLIAQAMEKVVKECVIMLKGGERTIEDEIEIMEGMRCVAVSLLYLTYLTLYPSRFDQGFISPYFVTDVRAHRVEFEKPLLSERKISLLQDILPSLEPAAQARRHLVIITDDVDSEALAACILNKLRGQLQVVAVKTPGFGDNRMSILGDLAILMGGTVFTDDLDIELERTTSDLLGSTGSITVTKEDTITLNGEGGKDGIQARCEQIQSLVADPTTSEFDRCCCY